MKIKTFFFILKYVSLKFVRLHDLSFHLDGCYVYQIGIFITKYVCIIVKYVSNFSVISLRPFNCILIENNCLKYILYSNTHTWKKKA